MKSYREIQIRGKTILVDDDDLELISKYRWTFRGCASGFYAICSYSKGVGWHKTVIMHRLITNCPEGMYVDHINHNTLDNRKENLRICTSQQNSQNRRKRRNCSSKYKGVHLWHYFKYRNGDIYKKWRAVIIRNHKFVNIGMFDSEIDAAKAYDKKALEFFGEYACLNFKPS